MPWLLAMTAAETVRSSAFLTDQVQPHAGLVAHNLRDLLQEHLSFQTARRIKQQADLPDAIMKPVVKAFELALSLKAELDAAGLSVKDEPFAPGAPYCEDEMHLSMHAHRVDQIEGHAIAMEYLPRIRRLCRDGKWSTISPAIVMLA